MNLDREYWQHRWIRKETGWDIGFASTPLIDFMKTYPEKDHRILIPGCGNAHEAEALDDLGFGNISLLDIAPEACALMQSRLSGRDHIRVLCEDFFEHGERYDLILEQTFFCALDPALRENYVAQAASLLVKGGTLAGVLFASEFDKPGPPFGGIEAEYRILFSKYFHIHRMESCRNSIPPRMGNELWIEMKRI